MNKITILLSSLFSFILIGHAQSTATYDINFTSTWNSADHGTLPGNAHWSNLVGANHNSNITFLEMGGTATQGIENVAELGSNSVFNAEVQSAINNGDAEQWLEQSFAPFAAISSATLTDITVSEDFPLLTVLSMIAPSPDWIIAVNSLNLWDTNMNKWKDSFTVDLYPYDAGTEEGFGYSTSNAPTVPRSVITNIAGVSGYPFNTEKIGTLTVTFKSTSLSIDEVNSLGNLRLYPNPTNVNSINYNSPTIIERVEFYDVLGKLVKQTEALISTSTTIAINELNSGLYLVKFYDSNNNSTTKKLVKK